MIAGFLASPIYAETLFTVVERTIDDKKNGFIEEQDAEEMDGKEDKSTPVITNGDQINDV
ncbi:2829_t:CDS:2 [Rhizophagus irregularis]|nr:2829_t:CDS:2 [Rhizophagus irregularis]